MVPFLVLAVVCLQLLNASYPLSLVKDFNGNSPKSAVFQTTDMLSAITSMIVNPFAHISLVNKALFDVVSMLDPAKILAEETGYEPFSKLERGHELLRLYILSRGIMKGRFPLTFAPGSAIWPESAITVEYAATLILNDVSISQAVKTRHFSRMAKHLIMRERFEAVGCLFRIVKNDLFNFRNWNNFDASYIAYRLAKVDLLGALAFSQVISTGIDSSDYLKALAGILSAPLPISVLDPLVSTSDLRKPELVCAGLRAVGMSCALQFEAPSDTPNLFFYRRNNALISRLEESTKDKSLMAPWARYAHLINLIRFGSANINIIKEEVLLCASRIAKQDSLLDSMLIAAVYSNRQSLFESIWSQQPRDDVPLGLVKAINQRPHFAKFVLNVRFKDTPSSISLRLKAARLDSLRGTSPMIRDIQENDNIQTRLVLMAELHPEQFDAKVKSIVNGKKFSSFHSAMNGIIDEIADPVPFISAILTHLPSEDLSTHAHCPLSRAKYLRALLLHGEDSSFSPADLRRFNVFPSVEFIQALLTDVAMSTAINSARGRLLIESLHVPIRRLVSEHALKARHIVRLFVILHMIPGTSSFSDEIDSALAARHDDFFNDATLHSISSHTMESGFLPCLALHAFKSAKGHRVPLHESVAYDTDNPLLLPAFDWFELWHQNDPINFWMFAPSSVVTAFIPRSPVSTLEEIMNARALDARLLRMTELYLKNTDVSLQFPSQDEMNAALSALPSDIRALLQSLSIQATFKAC